MRTVEPKKLTSNSHIRVIAPSKSFSVISEEVVQAAINRLRSVGFRVTIARNCANLKHSVEERVEDLHEAFSDNSVDAIFTAIGGYSSNQLLEAIDYEIIKRNPKILCGFSDITALLNAILAKTGLITYYGPHFSSWGMKHGFEYSQEHFLRACLGEEPINLFPSDQWSCDSWFLDQEKRTFFENDGYWVLNEGHAEGTLIGGNSTTLILLSGTQFMPSLKDSILLLEQTGEYSLEVFDQHLQSLLHQPDSSFIRGILIGRFQPRSRATRADLEALVKAKKKLAHVPIVANVDFGHTTPIVTMPIGKSIRMTCAPSSIRLKVSGSL